MINLLPPKYKEELKSEDKMALVFVLEILIFISFLVLSLILFTIKINIQGLVDEQNIFLAASNKKISQLKSQEQQLTALNRQLMNLDSFYKNRPDLTLFVERISEISPEGLYLNAFSYQEDAKLINISGFSPRVEDLLAFKANLEEQKDFKEINFPTAVWLQSKNINFNASFKIVKE